MAECAPPLRVCVVGGGWAGIAAAVQATRLGHAVTLLEMAPHLGGRARRVAVDGIALDNGQHILIGAYRATLGLMAAVGAPVDDLLERRPLELLYPDGSGLRLPRGAALPAFVRGVIGARGWSWRDRLGLLGAAASWTAARFRCPPGVSVAQLTRRLPARLRADLIEPLCVAALNTPAPQASADVFLRVLRDALFSGPGSADLLLPRQPLSALLPEPAQRWLAAAGATLHIGTRAGTVERCAGGWRVDGTAHDAVVLACSAAEAARLSREVAPHWSRAAAAFDYEPIVTAYLSSPGTRLGRPMVALRAGVSGPAQFVFDHGLLNGTPGEFAAVVSGARPWVDRGTEATAVAIQQQLLDAFPPGTWLPPPRVVRVLVEKRATFLCTPGLQRPGAAVAPGLIAAGDYVDGPYPATLEGAVRSGLAAADAVTRVSARS